MGKSFSYLISIIILAVFLFADDVTRSYSNSADEICFLSDSGNNNDTGTTGEINSDKFIDHEEFFRLEHPEVVVPGISTFQYEYALNFQTLDYAGLIWQPPKSS